MHDKHIHIMAKGNKTGLFWYAAKQRSEKCIEKYEWFTVLVINEKLTEESFRVFLFSS